MKKLLVLFLFAALSITGAAQQSVIIPPPLVDGKTCTVTASTGMLTCPGAVTYNSTTGVLSNNGVPITNLSLQVLSLTSGTSYPNGTYLVTIENGSITYTPYTAPTSYKVAQPSQAGFSVASYLVPGLTNVPGKPISFYPNATGAPSSWQPTLAYLNAKIVVNAANQVYLVISNTTSAALPASGQSISWTVIQ